MQFNYWFYGLKEAVVYCCWSERKVENSIFKIFYLPLFLRKLKNRVAAQSARDRKKAHMDQLEITLMRVEKEVSLKLIQNVIYFFVWLPKCITNNFQVLLFLINVLISLIRTNFWRKAMKIYDLKFINLLNQTLNSDQNLALHHPPLHRKTILALSSLPNNQMRTLSLLQCLTTTILWLKKKNCRRSMHCFLGFPCCGISWWRLLFWWSRCARWVAGKLFFQFILIISKKSEGRGSLEKYF